MPNPKKLRNPCKHCGKEVNQIVAVFCSSKCQRDYHYEDFIAKWKRDEVSGGRMGATVRNPIRRYLLERDGEKCSQCGWCCKHPITGKVPLEIHHIDGDHNNNSEPNLQLLCPNCHSLTATYRFLNKGNGRAKRRKENNMPA